MFLGHYGVALALKRVEPKVSLGTLFVAAQLVDVLWGVFLLLGWEHVRILPDDNPLLTLQFYDYPISHSLVGALAWSLLFAAAYQLLGRGESALQARRRNALLLGAGVFSHWILDVLVHRPDVPVLPHGPYIGLGLWDQPAVEMILEGGLYALGIYLYLRATRSVELQEINS